MRALGKPCTEATSHAHVFVWDASKLVNIYEDGVNFCVWHRGQTAALARWLDELAGARDFHLTVRLRADALDLRPHLGTLAQNDLSEAWLADVHFLLRLYADLFGAEELGIRLHTLSTAICPNFHVDRVGVRMLCSYAGPATEWVGNAHVARSSLGKQSQVLTPDAQVRALERFDVALLKGEAWPGNLGNGLVHRSPFIPPSSRRLLLSVEATAT